MTSISPTCLLSEQRFDGLVRHLVFEGDDAGVGAELTRHILHQLGIERLVHGDEDAAHQQRRDEVLAADSELSARSLTLMPSVTVMVRVMGSGSCGICAPPKRDGGAKPFIGPSLVFGYCWRPRPRGGPPGRCGRGASPGGGTRPPAPAHAGTLAEARTATWATRTRAKAGTAARSAAGRRARGMHGPATCRKAWSAGRSAGTLRIAARATRTLEDGTAALDDATGAGRRAGRLGRNGARRRRTVDGPWAGLRHDHALDGRQRLLQGLPEPQARQRPAALAGGAAAAAGGAGGAEGGAATGARRSARPQRARGRRPDSCGGAEAMAGRCVRGRGRAGGARPEDGRRLGRQAASQQSPEPAVEARSRSAAPGAAEA